MRAILALACYIRALTDYCCALRIHQFAHVTSANDVPPGFSGNFATREAISGRSALTVFSLFCRGLPRDEEPGYTGHSRFLMMYPGSVTSRLPRHFLWQQRRRYLPLCTGEKTTAQGAEERPRCCSAVASRYFPTLVEICAIVLSSRRYFLQAATSKESAKIHKLLRPKSFQDLVHLFLQGWRSPSLAFQARKWTKHRFGDNYCFSINQSKPILYSCKIPVLFSCAAEVSLFSCAIFQRLPPPVGSSFSVVVFLPGGCHTAFAFLPNGFHTWPGAGNIYLWTSLRRQAPAPIMPAPASGRKT